jgi:multidrug efflux pump
MKSFNLSEWALRHRSLVTYFMLMIVVAGIADYFKLGRSEDPDFTVKTMVVGATWPGATVEDTLEQITDRLERKLQETPSLDYVKSYTSAGRATIFVNLKDSTRPADVPDIWYASSRTIPRNGRGCSNIRPASPFGFANIVRRSRGRHPR